LEVTHSAILDSTNGKFRDNSFILTITFGKPNGQLKAMEQSNV